MTLAIVNQFVIVCLFLALAACSTVILEMESECIMKKWHFFGIVMRSEVLCAAPHQRPEEDQIQDWEQVDPLGGAKIEDRLRKSLGSDGKTTEKDSE